METEIINDIKLLAIDMIFNSKSGHPGVVLSSAPIIYTLYSKFMNVSVNDDKWISRDRFVLSSGHASALLYATLFMAGFNLTINDLKNFRKIDSKTPGHPEYDKTPGVDVSTGALGQGIATAVGIAYSQKLLKKKYFFPKKSILENDTALLDYNVYVLCGDGDLMEGISYEACSFAGSNNLDNLILLYDSNKVSLDGETKQVFDENISDRFKSMGWNYEYVRNGNSVLEIEKAIKKAKSILKPSIIEINTIIGQGLPCQGKCEAHGKLITKDDINILYRSLNITNRKMFDYSENARNSFMKMISDRSNNKYNQWSNNYRIYVDKYFSGESSYLNFLFNHNITYRLLNSDFHINFEEKEDLREINQKIIVDISRNVSNFIGGSADLSRTTKAFLPVENIERVSNYDDRNISFGVREHSMGAICNGLVLGGFRPFCSTMLAFSDFLKPSIRMSALMKLPVVYIFSHDSIDIGQDGPTHQPVEQLTSLRLIPNLRVYRPVDANELVGCWDLILSENSCPSALILSKHDSILLPTTNSKMVSYGAYIVRHEKQKLDGIIVATGSDVYTAINLSRYFFLEKNIDLRIVSMPEMNLFLNQSIEYQLSIIPKNVVVFAIESASYLPWIQFATSKKHIFSVDNFGYSGTRDEVMKKCGIDFETIKLRIETLI